MNRRPDRNRPAALVLLAHGSRDEQWKAPFERLADRLTHQLGRGRVANAYLQMTGPTLEQAAERLHAGGARRIVVLPLFLAPGGHVRKDVPEKVEALREQMPDTEFVEAATISEDARIWDTIETVALEHASVRKDRGR